MERKRVGIVLFENVEVLDFAGPYEVLTAVRLDEAKRWDTKSPFDVLLVAEALAPINCYGGMRVIPDHTLDACPSLDILIVPGGWGTRQEIANAHLVNWIRDRGQKATLTASVCTGARLLATAGLLNGRRATTHWNSLGWLKENFPQVRVEDALHVVDEGDLITSAGISAGIELALRIVERHFGNDVARNTAHYMEYRYPYDNTRRV
jgi:transcriptional regulator GlxA family with amidase domain